MLSSLCSPSFPQLFRLVTHRRSYSKEAKSSGREEELLEQIKEKDKKISELESKLAEAHETIKAKDQTIEDLKKQLAAKGEGAGTSAEGAAQVETVKPTVVGTPSFTSLAQQQKDEPQAQSAVIVGNSPMRKASRAGHVAESAGSPRPTGAAAAADGKKKKKKKDKGKEKDSTVTEESTTAGDLSSPEDSASTPGSTIKASEGATPTVASTDDTSAAASASSAAPAAVGGRRLPRPTSDKAVLEPDCELSHINLRKGAGLKTAFHDLNLAVNISGGGTTALGAHTSIVTARCPQFHKTIKEQQEKRKKKGKAPIQLDVRAHDVASVNYLLDFLYCDKVEFPKMSPIDVLHLIIVARAYGLNRLRWIAEDYLLQIINMKNVVELLKQSSTLGEKTVKCICLDFLLEPEHFAQFVQLKESINTLGLELFQEVVAINATKATTGPQTEDRGSCPPSTLRKDFKKLYETMEYSDSFVKLEAKNIPFHKAILAAHSKKLAKAFSEKKKENAKASDEDMTDVLKLVDLTVQTLPPGKKKAFRMSEAAFRSMLKYVYYGETEIDPLPACELVNWAHHYDMSALKKLCEQHIQNGITPGFVINIMAVTYLAIMRERADMMSLRQQCIQFAMENLASIKLERIRDMDGALDIAIDLLLACQKMVQSAS
ncbi:Kelch motif [Balamuthia mandrillaris]